MTISFKISVQFIGYQDRPNGTSFPLFNDDAGSTVSLATLEKRDERFRVENMHLLRIEYKREKSFVACLVPETSRNLGIVAVNRKLLNRARVFCPCEICQLTLKSMIDFFAHFDIRSDAINLSDAIAEYAPEMLHSDFFAE